MLINVNNKLYDAFNQNLEILTFIKIHDYAILLILKVAVNLFSKIWQLHWKLPILVTPIIFQYKL